MSQSALKRAPNARRQEPSSDDKPEAAGDGAGGVSCRPLGLEEQLLEAVQRNQKLEQLNACFEAALNHMGRGLSMFDADQRLVVCNTAYSRTYCCPRS